MKFISTLLMGAVLIFSTSACYSLKYSNASQTAPATYGLKHGRACASSVLSMIAWGDSSIETAAADAGITSVSSVSWEKSYIVGFVYNSHCTIVTGT